MSSTPFWSAVQSLRQRVTGDENRELRRAFTVWIHRVILPSRMSKEAIPPVESLEDIVMVVRTPRLTWFERGVEQGLKLGAADTLLHLLTLRFGTVPDEVRARLEVASVEILLGWSEQMLTAATIEEALPPVEDLEGIMLLVQKIGPEVTEKGEQRGRQLGAADTLLHLLVLRFGAVPDEVRARVAEAEMATLLRWTEQLLTAATIEDVLR